MTIFFRLIEAEDKATALCEAVAAANAADGPRPENLFSMAPQSFRQVPGAPFAYWVSDAVRASFRHLPALATGGRTVKQGLVTADDFRFIRAWWETEPARFGQRWFCFAKGGSYSPFYADLVLLVGYSEGDQVGLQQIGRYGRGATHYFRPGFTWPLRTQRGLSMRAMPAGCIFSHKGPAAFVDGDDPHTLLALLAVVNSRPFSALVELQMAFGSYEVGVIQRTPLPPLTTDDQRPTTLSTLAHRAWSLKRSLDTATETSHAFTLPALLQVAGDSLAARVSAWNVRVAAAQAELAAIQQTIDDLCFTLYGIDGEDRRRIEAGFGNPTEALSADDRRPTTDDDEQRLTPEDQTDTADPAPLTALLCSWTLGVAFGCFDHRRATGAVAAPAEPGPFDPLPVCSPAMLTGDDGLPLAAPPPADPVAFPTDGILVDDPGHGHDLLARTGPVWRLVCGEAADACRQEAAQTLAPGAPDLRGWFSGNCFGDHLKRYSKSRRKAPIYWQLATPSASYSVWLYYHRFTRDTFYKVLNDFVTPKLQHEERKLTGLVQVAGGTPTANQRKEIAEQEGFVEEVRAFREEVARVAPLWNPDLNDGVIINFAPLWRLVSQHRAWQKECKDCWDKLVAGGYDWSHLAMHLWPERVVPKCATDRSLAIAHGLEAVFWNEGDNGKWLPRTVAQAEVEHLIAERTSAAVKDALNSLLESPAPATGRGGGRQSSARAPVRRVPTAPRSGDASPGSRPATGSAAPDPVMLDAVKQVIAAARGGTSKSEVLVATGLSDTQWNLSINALLAAGTVTKTGVGRGTRYHLSATD
ncbi:hypothetical protein [uncultured Thiodictyon sp.]|uniref:hypothetical protein n=1 Tax=uncultured Thiodictyon sp. TaxID=1846217 RepID=UPI0025CEEFD0|nr:hypothetical protein [uncultured Thiodictyon sp.]